jgi:hypothetical protein
MARLPIVAKLEYGITEDIAMGNVSFIRLVNAARQNEGFHRKKN